MGPGGIKLPRFAEEVLALAKAVATDRATADEALNKTAIGIKFVAGELTADLATITELHSPTAELEEATIENLIATGPITTIRFSEVTIGGTGGIQTFTHNLGFVPWVYMIQYSVNGGATWYPFTSGTENHLISATTTTIVATNNNSASRLIKCAIVG